MKRHHGALEALEHQPNYWVTWRQAIMGCLILLSGLCPYVRFSPLSIHIPNNSVCADNKLWPGVPLVVGDVVMCLKPDPLLAFGEKSVVAGLSFAILHHCGDSGKQAWVMFKVKMELWGILGDVLTVFVTFGQDLEIIYMVIVISWRTQDLKGEVTYDRRSSEQREVITEMSSWYQLPLLDLSLDISL